MDLLPGLRADKSKEFYEALETFVNDVHTSVSHLNATISHYCDGDKNNARKFANFVIDYENKADNTRRKLEKMLYAGVVLPFGRSSKYEMLESLDDVADKAEVVARLILIERIKISPPLKKDFKELSRAVLEVATELKQAVMQLDLNLEKSISHATKVELIREKVRQIEFRLIKKLFANGENTLNIILLKELITLTSAVADKSEEAADRLLSLAVKYQN